jgi:hypothetical protein
VKHASYRLSQEFLSPHDIEEVDGLPLTSVRWSVCFESRWADDLVSAVIAIDMAAYSDLISVSELRPYVASRMAPTGIEQARKAVGLAVENSWSPQETVMRLAWAAWRPESVLVCNCPVFDAAGRHLATPDVLDPVAGVAGEYEGGVHLCTSTPSGAATTSGGKHGCGTPVWSPSRWSATTRGTTTGASSPAWPQPMPVRRPRRTPVDGPWSSRGGGSTPPPSPPAELSHQRNELGSWRTGERPDRAHVG